MAQVRSTSDGPGVALTESYWRREESIPLVDSTVGELLAERARTHTDVVALVGTRHGDGTEVRLTYAELYDEALHVATGLSTVADRGDFVALWAPNVVEWPIIQYGAALAGVVLVALNPVLRESELEYALTHSGARVLLFADRSRAYDLAAVVDVIRPRFPELKAISLSDRGAWRADDSDPAVVAAAPTDPDAAVMLQYTSGTTGNPKGVLLRHRSLVNVAKLTLEATGVRPGAVTINPLPMFHTAACVIGTLGPLWIGGTEVLIERFVPGPVLDTIRRENVTVLFFVPAILAALVEELRTSGTAAPALDTVMGGAANVAESLIEAAERTFGATVINLFGQTELAPVLSATRPGDSRTQQLQTVGRPLPNVDCKIVDPISRETLPLGEVGEICARGYQQLIGYHRDADATARTVDAEGFVHTGDLGTMDAAGYLTVTGRLKELIIRGGENVAPAEVESRLLESDLVLDVSVVGLPDEEYGEVVAAVVRVRGDEPDDIRAQLEGHARHKLSPYKVPARWFVADAFPVTPTGKVRKFALAEAIDRGELRELTTSD